MATRTNIELLRGNDINLNFTYWTDAPTNTVAGDITGWTIVFSMSKDSNSVEKLIDARACSLTNPTGGAYRAVLTAAEIAALEPGDYSWEVTRTNTGSVTTLGYGTARVVGAARTPLAA